MSRILAKKVDFMGHPIQHGFDFRAQYSLSIGYNRGNDATDKENAGKEDNWNEKRTVMRVL